MNDRKKYLILPKEYQKKPNKKTGYLLKNLFSTFVFAFTSFVNRTLTRLTRKT